MNNYCHIYFMFHHYMSFRNTNLKMNWSPLVMGKEETKNKIFWMKSKTILERILILGKEKRGDAEDREK